MGKILDIEAYKKTLIDKLRSNNPQLTLETLNEWLSMDKERLSWLNLCNSFSPMELFLRSLFYENHEVKEGRNIDAGFIVGFGEDQLDALESSTLEQLKALGREVIMINAIGNTFREMVQIAIGQKFRTNHEAYDYLIKILLDTDTVVVVKAISASKIPTGSKGGYIHSIIKYQDDAIRTGIVPRSDLIFIDHAAFLQSVWNEIGEYVKVATFR